MHTARAGMIAWLLGAAACGDGRMTGPSEQPLPPERPPLATVPIPLPIPTYEGSGQVVHPDVLWFPSGWRGYRFWMAMTPYPNGDARLENPSVVASNDGRSWEVPAGLVNPVVPAAPFGAHNSDPDLVYDPVDDRLILFYRVVRNSLNVIAAVTSDDGVEWDQPVDVLIQPSHRAVSPAVFLLDRDVPYMWYVDAGDAGCSAQTTTVVLRMALSRRALTPSSPGTGWRVPRPTDLKQPGYVVWHLDVIYVPDRDEFWSVFAAYREGTTCGQTDLFFARSPDGASWTTYPEPLLETGFAEWAGASLYRGTLLYDPDLDALSIWFSARSDAGAWGIGLVEAYYDDIIKRLEGIEPDVS